MNIAYLFESSWMSGGHRVAIAQADALIARGHRVRCVTKGGPVDWCPSRAEWIHVGELTDYNASGDDFVVGTFYTTLRPGHAIAGARAVHLCQGYEGAIAGFGPLLHEIEAAYSLPLPKMVVSPHLVPICRRFSPDVALIGQIVDASFFRESVPPENDPLRLLVVGEHQYEHRGIVEAYRAVQLARQSGACFDLVRVTSQAADPNEPSELAVEFHSSLPTWRMTEVMHSCDLLLGASHPVEGFGLPPAEAMASGIPVILTRIPAYLEYDEVRDYALFAEPGEAGSIAAALVAMAGDSELRARLRARGRKVAGKFDAARVAERIERFLLSL